MQEDYKVLGVSENATDSEIKESYEALKAKYSVDRFLDGEAGNAAAKNLTRLEQAYKAIKEERASGGYKSDDGNGNTESVYTEIEKLIVDKKLSEAQAKLDAFNERDAEWHYVQARLYYVKEWMNESKKQLEIAKNMEPENQKYINAYNKLLTASSTKSSKKEQSAGSNVPPQQQPQQMGSNGCDDACTCCQAAICADCLCSCCR